VHNPSEDGGHIAALRERLRARREAERRGLRSFTIGLSEDDLRLLAKRGYGGALSADHEQQTRAACRFITDALVARLDRLRRRLQRRFSKASQPL
jgi:hypothetical protein